jgi:nucleotide-binding universal stress UspA family protein
VTRGAKVPVLVVKKRGGQPYRRIIAATDLSDASMPAIATGLHLFGEADLTVFHAFSAPLNRFVTDSDKYRAELHRGAYADCRAAIAQVSAAAADELAIVAEYGDPASTLAEYAQAANADLVLAGTHGRTGLLNVLLGSVAAEILVKAPCDVMVIPSRPTRPGTAT